MTVRACSIEGCDRPSRTRGWCVRHYGRWQRNGDPLAGRRGKGEKLQWLLDNYRADPTGPCVVWPFSTDAFGYGRHVGINGRSVHPHAYAVELRDGPRPAGMQARHGPCNNPACIIHVSWGTPLENAADKIRDGTIRRGERHTSAKLTPTDVREIRRRVAAGETRPGLAQAFGVTQAAISAILNRKSWAWLE